MKRPNLSWAPSLLLALLLALGGFGLAGCGGEEPSTEETPEANAESETPEATEETPEAEAEAEPEPEEAEIAATEVPVEDDFADEASEQITTENYASELAALEQEIQGEGGEGGGEESE